MHYASSSLLITLTVLFGTPFLLDCLTRHVQQQRNRRAIRARLASIKRDSLDRRTHS